MPLSPAGHTQACSNPSKLVCLGLLLRRREAPEHQAAGRPLHLPGRPWCPCAGRGPPAQPGLCDRPPLLRHVLLLHQPGARARMHCDTQADEHSAEEGRACPTFLAHCSCRSSPSTFLIYPFPSQGVALRRAVCCACCGRTCTQSSCHCCVESRDVVPCKHRRAAASCKWYLIPMV